MTDDQTNQFLAWAVGIWAALMTALGLALWRDRGRK
jgi:hypothetical protein